MLKKDVYIILIKLGCITKYILYIVDFEDFVVVISKENL